MSFIVVMETVETKKVTSSALAQWEIDTREDCKSCTIPEVHVYDRLLTDNNVGGQGGYTFLTDGHSWKITYFPLYDILPLLR